MGKRLFDLIRLFLETPIINFVNLFYYLAYFYYHL